MTDTTTTANQMDEDDRKILLKLRTMKELTNKWFEQFNQRNESLVEIMQMVNEARQILGAKTEEKKNNTKITIKPDESDQ
jgi:hypothetical protein